jgi:hypothetical protein
MESASPCGKDLQIYKTFPRNVFSRGFSPPLFLVPCGFSLHYQIPTLVRVTPIADSEGREGESDGFGPLHYIMSPHWYK